MHIAAYLRWRFKGNSSLQNYPSLSMFRNKNSNNSRDNFVLFQRFKKLREKSIVKGKEGVKRFFHAFSREVLRKFRWKTFTRPSVVRFPLRDFNPNKVSQYKLDRKFLFCRYSSPFDQVDRNFLGTFFAESKSFLSSEIPSRHWKINGIDTNTH